MKLELDTQSAEDTRQLAAQIAVGLQPGSVILLYGELGAGKTTFVQGLAEGMGIDTPVTSPTFTLIHEYRGSRLSLIHLDCYRLDGPDDVESLGWDELLARGDVVVVEWPERLGPLTPPQRLEVHISSTGELSRHLDLTSVGDLYDACCAFSLR